MAEQQPVRGPGQFSLTRQPLPFGPLQNSPLGGDGLRFHPPQSQGWELALSPALVPAGPGLRPPPKDTPDGPQAWLEEDQRRCHGDGDKPTHHEGPPGLFITGKTSLSSAPPRATGVGAASSGVAPGNQVAKHGSSKQHGKGKLGSLVREYEQHLARSVVIILSLL